MRNGSRSQRPYDSTDQRAANARAESAKMRAARTRAQSDETPAYQARSVEDRPRAGRSLAAPTLSLPSIPKSQMLPKLPPPKEKERRPRGQAIMQWFITVLVGVAAIALLLNRTLLLQQTASKPTTPQFTARQITTEMISRANAILGTMTLDEKFGQLMVPMADDTSMNSDMQQMISQAHIGGFFVVSDGLGADPIKTFVSQMQAASTIPMIMSADYEGDAGFNTLVSAIGAQASEYKIGLTGDPQKAYDKGVIDAQKLASIGVNVNYAPVVDVLTNPNSPILQGRTFSNDPNLVTQYASKYIEGLESGGVAGTLKHFPGLGASGVDPHKSLPVIDRTVDQMRSVELLPYQRMIDSEHVGMIMTTHMLMPSLDPKLPTSISPAVINGLLRNDMHYDGVVVSDALFMGGLTNTYTMEQAGVLAFEAGTDLLLGSQNFAQTMSMINALKTALQNGEFTQQYLDNSVLRILKFKLQWGIIPKGYTHPSAVVGGVPPLADSAIDRPRASA